MTDATTGAAPNAEPRNALLAAMSADDHAWMAERSTPIKLELRDTIAEPSDGDGVVFPESGIISLVARAPDVQLEVGLAGREGAAGLATILGTGSAPLRSFVQLAGRGQHLGADAMAGAMERPGIRSVMLAHVHVAYVQVAQTALANGRNTIEERLARWLLMVQDRQDGSDIRITHEFLSLMLGVHRPGVTLALHVLEGAGLLRSTRGLVTIRDRGALKEVAGRAYGVAEAEHARLFPTAPTRH